MAREGARKILILDWKGPGDKIALVPRVVDCEDAIVDGIDIFSDGVEVRTTYPQNEGYRIRWRMVITPPAGRRRLSSLTKPHISKLMGKSLIINRVMLVRVIDRHPQADLRLDDMPKERFDKYIAPLMTDNFDIKMAQIHPSVRLLIERRAHTVEFMRLRELYSGHIPADDEQAAKIWNKYHEKPDNPVENADIALTTKIYGEVLVTLRPDVYQRYISDMKTLSTPSDTIVDAIEDADIDFD